MLIVVQVAAGLTGLAVVAAATLVGANLTGSPTVAVGCGIAAGIGFGVGLGRTLAHHQPTITESHHHDDDDEPHAHH